LEIKSQEKSLIGNGKSLFGKEKSLVGKKITGKITEWQT